MAFVNNTAVSMGCRYSHLVMFSCNSGEPLSLQVQGRRSSRVFPHVAPVTVQGWVVRSPGRHPVFPGHHPGHFRRRWGKTLVTAPK